MAELFVFRCQLITLITQNYCITCEPFSFVLHDLFNLFISLQLSDGSDYTTRRQTLVFDQNNLDLNITVPVLDNDIHEPLEDFFGRLETEDSSTTLTPNSTVIRILDDDCRLHEYIGPYAGTIVTITVKLLK